MEVAVKALLSTVAKPGVVALALIADVAFSISARAADPNILIGSWKLVSWQVIVGDETQNPFGLHPKGFLVLTREGRAIVLTIADSRTPGEGPAERAALHKSMLSYSGKYRLEGEDFITTVDISWNQIWNGTEQRRHYRIEGDRLFIDTVPAPSITNPGKIDFRRLVWEREN
jgi:hypothetical protein